MEAGDAGHLHYPDSPPDSIGTSSTSAQTNVHAGKRKCSGNHFAEEWKFKPGEKTCQDCLARKRQRNANKKRAAQEQLGREPCARCAKEVIGYRTQLHQLRLENGQLRAENAALQASPATKKDPLPVDAEVALRERDFVSWAFENPDLMEAEVDIDVLDPSSQVGLSEDSLWVDHDTLEFHEVQTWSVSETVECNPVAKCNEVPTTEYVPSDVYSAEEDKPLPGERRRSSSKGSQHSEDDMRYEGRWPGSSLSGAQAADPDPLLHDEPPPYTAPDEWIAASNPDSALPPGRDLWEATAREGVEQRQHIPFFFSAGMFGLLCLLIISMLMLCCMAILVGLEIARAVFYWCFHAMRGARLCLPSRMRCASEQCCDPCGLCLSAFGPAMWLSLVEFPFRLLFFVLWGVEILVGLVIPHAAALVILVFSLSLKQSYQVLSSCLRLSIAVSHTCRWMYCRCKEDSLQEQDDCEAQYRSAPINTDHDSNV